MRILKFCCIYANSQGQCFDQSTLSACSYQTADSTDLKTTLLQSSTKNAQELHNITKCTNFSARYFELSNSSGLTKHGFDLVISHFDIGFNIKY